MSNPAEKNENISIEKFADENIILEPDVKAFLLIVSRACGVSMSKLANEIFREKMENKRELYSETIDFIAQHIAKDISDGKDKTNFE